MSAAGWALSIFSTSRAPAEVDAPLQPLEAGGPALVVEGDDLAVDEERASRVARSGSSARTIEGNWDVFRCPAATRCGRRPVRVPGATCTRARMPSYFGS